MRRSTLSQSFLEVVGGTHSVHKTPELFDKQIFPKLDQIKRVDYRRLCELAAMVAYRSQLLVVCRDRKKCRPGVEFAMKKDKRNDHGIANVAEFPPVSRNHAILVGDGSSLARKLNRTAHRRRSQIMPIDVNAFFGPNHDGSTQNRNECASPGQTRAADLVGAQVTCSPGASLNSQLEEIARIEALAGDGNFSSSSSQPADSDAPVDHEHANLKQWVLVSGSGRRRLTRVNFSASAVARQSSAARLCADSEGPLRPKASRPGSPRTPTRMDRPCGPETDTDGGRRGCLAAVACAMRRRILGPRAASGVAASDSDTGRSTCDARPMRHL